MNWYAYAGGSPLARVDPTGLLGIGPFVQASTYSGDRCQGSGGSLGGGGGLFVGGGGFGLGGFAEAGGFSGNNVTGPGWRGRRYPSQPADPSDPAQSPAAYGGYAGAGGGIFVTNANRASDVRGPFHNWGADIGWGTWGVSFNVAVSPNTGIVIITLLPIGVGGGVDVHSYDTNTFWAGDVRIGK